MTCSMEKLYFLTGKYVQLGKELNSVTAPKAHASAQLFYFTFIYASCYCSCSVATAETSKLQVTAYPVFSTWCHLFIAYNRVLKCQPAASTKQLHPMEQDMKENLEVHCYIQHFLLSIMPGILKLLPMTKPIHAASRKHFKAFIPPSVPHKCKMNMFPHQIMLSKVGQISLNSSL